ncbi:MAG: GIY-YIG nuclease family protein [bacterium]
MVFSKSHIIAEIKRTTKNNNGSPLGISRFKQETGIQKYDWLGKYWARWGDALKEAGFEPNTLRGRRDENELLVNLVQLTRHFGHFPYSNEIKLWGRENPGFPSHNTFRRFGKKKDQLERLVEYTKQHGYSDVEKICIGELSLISAKHNQNENDNDNVINSEQIIGYVYLLRSEKFYKIGRTTSLERREYELKIQLPEKPTKIHHIKTDDPVGIEKYWHERFKDRRKNGEWFELTKDDVTAFKRRKFM